MSDPTSREHTELGELESAVMTQLWHSPTPMRGREVLDALDRGLAYTTVMTVLDRLARKGFVERTRAGRAWTYRPAESREELTARALHATLGGLSDDERRAALLHFVGDASSDDLAALRGALADLEARQTD